MAHENFAIDKRFLTTKTIDIYDSPKLVRLLRRIPADTLLPYHRKVIRNGQRLAQALEADGSYSYFRYSESTISCEQCIVKGKGLDVLLADPQKLKDVAMKVDKKEFIDTAQQLEHSQIEYTPGYTQMLLKDRQNDKDTLLLVNIAAYEEGYALKHVERNEKFYILSQPYLSKGKGIVFPTGEKGLLFHEEGTLYKTIEDALGKMSMALIVILGIIILVGGIIGILATTGFIIIVGIIMVPVAFIAAGLMVMPLIGLLRLLGRFF